MNKKIKRAKILSITETSDQNVLNCILDINITLHYHDTTKNSGILDTCRVRANIVFYKMYSDVYHSGKYTNKNKHMDTNLLDNYYQMMSFDFLSSHHNDYNFLASIGIGESKKFSRWNNVSTIKYDIIKKFRKGLDGMDEKIKNLFISKFPYISRLSPNIKLSFSNTYNRHHTHNGTDLIFYIPHDIILHIYINNYREYKLKIAGLID